MPALIRSFPRWGGVAALSPGHRYQRCGEMENLGCTARRLGKWSDFRRDFSSYLVIEDLTHKTGNFKQFSIFCNMLESALTQSSESVTLDLLTYTDLEALRSRKLGGRPSTLAPRSAQLNSKRYLILIYSVEFDRIHYPLPLPYQGKPDPVVLQGIIRSLKEELSRLRGLDGQNTRDTRDTRETRETEIWHLREQVSRLATEKRELEAQLGRSREEALAARAARQEAEALRGLVRGLELELRQERGSVHRTSARRSQDCRRLAKELEEVKASERSLRARLKTLQAELALYKRGRRTPPVLPPVPREERASLSRERSTSRGRGATRSSSRESGRGARGRGRPARSSPSPTGSRAPRFDPTAFVKAKEKKQREIRMKQQRNRRGSGGSGDGPSVSWSRPTRPPAAETGRGDAVSRSRRRSSSVDSFRSRYSTASSASELEDFSESLTRGVHRVRGKPPSPTPWSGHNVPSPRDRSGHQKHLANSGGWVPIKEYSSDHQAVDMAEIDARLKALQEYMNRLDTRS
ncbi:centrosomal protein CCDC61 isoform X2 [Perognathus longimembris pacificus]|uniref:centrosomal protein CCDC61 isoform X2 n=1 Tax=Perognathus longimembris pacificus TaxID=214514 RepID=UPI00201A0631|nr:centrosomal protein CCDC61 isoform X2 [Perognathus longimembris pacificus]